MAAAGPRAMFTVLGASGFVGSNLTRSLQSRNLPCWSPSRGESVFGRPLGHVVYCIGLTADSREKPFETVQAHVCSLTEILERADFESFLYLSSTRVYAGSTAGREDSSLSVNSTDPHDLYNLSKLMGESICLASGRPAVRIVRLSNVYGNDFSSQNFLASMLRDVVEKNKVVLRTSLDSEKDYVSIEDVVSVLPSICLSGAGQIYNVARGANTSHRMIVQELQQVTGCDVEVTRDAPTTRFPKIAIDRVRTEFGFRPAPLLGSLASLVSAYRQALSPVSTSPPAREQRIDLDTGTVTVRQGTGEATYGLGTPEGFALVSQAWLRAGWDAKQVYTFTWLGRPIIQLPEDLVRIQEVIYRIKPDLIIETGVAHGGSMVFYASLCKAMNHGRVIGVDVEIRRPNREALEAHELSDYITLIEGSSIAPATVEQVKVHAQDATVMVLLDSCHTKAHVLSELEAYAPLVTPGSYIVAMDGIMEDVAGAPRTEADWSWNNPRRAALEFVGKNQDYVIEEPPFAFNEGHITQRVTYWPSAFIRRIK